MSSEFILRFVFRIVESDFIGRGYFYFVFFGFRIVVGIRGLRLNC